MIEIYTTPSCSSCRKAKKWFKEYEIEYREKNIINTKLKVGDIMKMLEKSESGFEDIISTRSKVFQESKVDLESLTTKELTNFILENPSVLRRPIIMDDRIMQIGYNDDEIRTFLPKEIRRKLICEKCMSHEEECDYVKELRKSLVK